MHHYENHQEKLILKKTSPGGATRPSLEEVTKQKKIRKNAYQSRDP